MPYNYVYTGCRFAASTLVTLYNKLLSFNKCIFIGIVNFEVYACTSNRDRILKCLRTFLLYRRVSFDMWGDTGFLFQTITADLCFTVNCKETIFSAMSINLSTSSLNRTSFNRWGIRTSFIRRYLLFELYIRDSNPMMSKWRIFYGIYSMFFCL